MCPLTLPDDRIYVETEFPRYQTFCVYSGEEILNWWEGTGEWDVTTDLVGIDLVTGKEIWRRPQGEAVDFGVATLDGEYAYVDLQVDDELIEMATGKVREVPEDYLAWIPQDYMIDPMGKSGYQRAGHFQPQRERADAWQLYWPLPEHLGASAGGIHALMTDDAIVGYRAG